MKVHVAIAAIITSIVLLVFWRLRDRDLPAAETTTEPALSLLLPHAGGCGWYRVSLPSGKTKQIARFHVDCNGAQIAWNQNATEAIVWMGSGFDLMAWHVRIGRPRATRITPPDGDLGRFFYVGERLFAYLHPENPGAKGSWVRQDGDAWVDAETAIPPPPEQNYPNNWQTVEDNHLFDQLDPLTSGAIRRTDRAWQRYRPDETKRSLLAYAAPSEVPRHIPALLKWDRQGQIEDLTGFQFAHPDTIVIMHQAPYLLIAESDNRMSPHVYSWDTGDLIYFSDPAHHAQFWPETTIPH